MPSTILASITSRPRFVAKNETTNTVVWSKLGIVDVEVDSDSANSSSPVASYGSAYQSVLSSDMKALKVIRPVRIRLTALCDDLSTIENVISTFMDDTATISINTKSVVATSLALTDVEIEQTGEMTSASKLVLCFEQVQPPASSGFAPSQPADSSLYGVSLQQPPSVVPLSTLAKAVKIAEATISKSVDGALIDQAGGPFILNSSALV